MSDYETEAARADEERRKGRWVYLKVKAKLNLDMDPNHWPSEDAVAPVILDALSCATTRKGSLLLEEYEVHREPPPPCCSGLQHREDCPEWVLPY